MFLFENEFCLYSSKKWQATFDGGKKRPAIFSEHQYRRVAEETIL
jgi:hypothetical protein